MDRRLTISALQQTGVISAADAHLCEAITRLTKESRSDVLLACALASQWPQRGHVCIDLTKLTAEDLFGDREVPDALTLPEFEPWLHELRCSHGKKKKYYSRRHSCELEGKFV